jgi:hypothetical protein
MKKLFVFTIAFFAITIISKAQCDGVTKWNCTKMKIIDESGNTVHEKDEHVTVEVSSKNISVTPEDDPDKMNGTVSDYTCKWTEPGKNGKTVLKSELLSNDGKSRHATVTIEAANGKITITLEATEESTKIVLEVADYAVVK